MSSVTIWNETFRPSARPLFQPLAVIGDQVGVQRARAAVENADAALVVAHGKDLAPAVDARERRATSKHAGVEGGDGAFLHVALAELEDLVEDAAHLALDDRPVRRRWPGVSNRRWSASMLTICRVAFKSLGVGFLGRDAHGLVRRLDDDLVGAGRGRRPRVPQPMTANALAPRPRGIRPSTGGTRWSARSR